MIGLFNQLAKARGYCAKYAWQCKERVTGQKQRTVQYKMMQKKTAGTLRHASGVIITLAVSAKKARQEAAMISKERAECCSKYQGAATVNEDKLTLMKQTALELRKLVVKSCVTTARLQV